ncbi:MAG: DUF4142 domain-containing protein [Candidatus Eiseniibacteriota bacterium]
MLRVVRRSTSSAALLSLLLASVLLPSCAKKTEEAPPPVTETPAPAPALTDANIAAIVVAANTIDIQNAELAKTKASNSAVKAFANQMITDHTAVNKQATDLVTKLGVTPEENDTSRGLVSGADATRKEMSAKTGADFDKAYIDNEVTYHQTVIDALDQTLVPGATNAELKALLEGVRPAFVAHLEHAKQIQADLAK